MYLLSCLLLHVIITSQKIITNKFFFKPYKDIFYKNKKKFTSLSFWSLVLSNIFFNQDIN